MDDKPTALQDAFNKKALLVIITVAVILRSLAALLTDSLNHPDENFQILEQAHRIVFGYGLIPWEFRFSVRSWLTPGFVIILLYPFKFAGLDNPDFYIPAIRLILGLVSVSIVYSAYHIGRKLVSPRAGLTAASFCAVWYEMIYFSMRPLSEEWATVFLFGAIALALTPTGGKRLFAAGFLAVLTAAVRIHYLPVVILFTAVAAFRLERRYRFAFPAAILITVVLIGLFEKLTLGESYASYINYFSWSQTYSMETGIARAGTFNYLMYLAYSSLFLSWLFFGFGIIVWKKLVLLLGCAVGAIITHLLVPIKEHLISMRFVFVAIPLLLTIGGIAFTELADRIANAGLRARIRYAFGAIFLLIAFLGSFGILPGQNQVYKHNLYYRDPGLQAYRYIYGEEHLAGVFDEASFWFYSGGCYYLHRDVPLYHRGNPPASPDYVSHVLTKKNMPPASGFELVKNFGDINLYVRSGRNFIYRNDPDYTRHMFQEGIDDRPGLMK